MTASAACERVDRLAVPVRIAATDRRKIETARQAAAARSHMPHASPRRRGVCHAEAAPLARRGRRGGRRALLGHGFGGQRAELPGPGARARWATRGWCASTPAGTLAARRPPRPRRTRRPRFVADLGRILDEQGVARAVVGGLSMGAGIALRFALAHPERTRALVLAAFPGERRHAGQLCVGGRAFRGAHRAGRARGGRRRVRLGPSSGLDAAAAALVRRGFLEHQPHAMAHVLSRRDRREQPPVSATSPRRSRGVRDPDPGDRRRARSALARPPCARPRRARFPAAQLVEIADAGHLVNLARPTEFNAAVAAFLEAPPRRVGARPTETPRSAGPSDASGRAASGAPGPKWT